MQQSQPQVSRKYARRRDGVPRGFTLIELLVVVAIISLLVSILLPSLRRAQELARGSVCLANEKALGLSLIFYAQEYGDVVPPHCDFTSGTFTWPMFLYNYGESEREKSFKCPATEFQTYELDLYYLPNNYTYPRVDDSKFLSISSFKSPSETPFLCDSQVFALNWAGEPLLYYFYTEGYSFLAHYEGQNLWFIDGHAMYLNDEELTDADFDYVDDYRLRPVPTP